MSDMITNHADIDVFIGIDVGKHNHHALALDRDGTQLLSKALPQNETKLKALITRLRKHGKLLVIVDQPATIGALPVAVAQAEGITVAYLPGLAMRRIADLHPGEAKTDARDAAIIAEAARTMPHTLRGIRVADENVAELSMLCGYDDDLAKQATATSNRIRGLLTQIHPGLETVIGPAPGPSRDAGATGEVPDTQGATACRQTPGRHAPRKQAPRAWKRWATAIFTALDGQTVVVSGTDAAGLVLPQLATSLAQTRSSRDEVLVRIEELVEAHPLFELLTSMPAVGVRTAARILTEVVGKDFESAGHLASYAGLAPVTWRSGTSIRGDHSSRRGNKILKRALFLSAFAALKDPLSRAYYDKKRAEHKKHNQALIALARRRCNVLYAMLRDGTYFHSPEVVTAA